MKKAYNRAGLSTLIVYGCMTMVTSVILGGMTGVFMGGIMAKSILNGPGTLEDVTAVLDQIKTFLKSQTFTNMSLLASVMGSALGVALGILIIRKVLPKERTEPERHTLSGGEFFLIALIAYGVWGVGVFVGNFPSFFGYSIPTGIENADKSFLVLYAVYAVIGAPLMEELVFRKLMIDSTHKFGETVAVFVSALLFGLMHANSAQFFLAMFLGLLFGTIYVRTGNIWYTIALHFLINLTGSIDLFLYVFAGIDIGNWMMLVVAVLMVVGLIVLFVSKKRDFLVLKRPVLKDANRQAFRNPGMIIAIVGGLVTIASMDLFLMLTDFVHGDLLSVIRLIPTGLVILSVILLACRVGRRTAEEPAPVLTSEALPKTETGAAPEKTSVWEESAVEETVIQEEPVGTAEETAEEIVTTAEEKSITAEETADAAEETVIPEEKPEQEV